jgi:hypothetical protein
MKVLFLVATERPRGGAVKVVECPCGKTVEAEDDDRIVEQVEAHIASDHPEMVGKYSREQILAMAQDR